MVLFVAYTGLSIYGSTKLGEGLPLGDLAPDDHYLKRFFNRDEETFRKDANIIAQMYFRNIEFSNPENQAKMLDARQMSFESEYLSEEASPGRNWLTVLVDYAREENPDAVVTVGDYELIAEADFYTLLRAWLKTNEGKTFEDDMVFEDDEKRDKIMSSRIPIAERQRNGEYSFNRLASISIYGVEDDINSELFPDQPYPNDITQRVCFIFEYNFLFFEQDRVMLSELLTNLGLALLGVFVVTLVLLVHPIAALLVALAVLCVDLFLFGELWMFNLRLNTVSVVNLVMAVGLAADYAIHIVHKFLSVDGESRKERMAITMCDIGQAVVQGGMTTMVSVIPLAFASSQVFRIFFAMIFGTALFGLIMGMIIVPIVLTWIGPARLLDEEQAPHESAIDAENGKNGEGKVEKEWS